MIDPMTGDQLKQFRNKHNLTQKELARIYGVDTETVSRFERVGAQEVPFAKIQAMACRALEIHGTDAKPLTVTGNKLRRFRTKRGWTGEQFAEFIGLSTRTVISYEARRAAKVPKPKIMGLAFLFMQLADDLENA